MVQGTLEVVLVGAKGLDNTEFLNNMDPYVILTYGGRKQKSSVASGQGSEPEWNQTFSFDVSSNGSDLTLRILDSDFGNEDDFVGEAIIPLEPVFHEREVPTTSYNVVKDQEFRGEIRVALSFTSKGNSRDRGMSQEESFGGWRESSSN